MGSQDEQHARLVRQCYEKAKTILRQRHDEEFHQILASVYKEAGLEVNKRISRIAARAARNKETPNG